MERIVITIHPSHPADGLLSVADAMQQVLDAISLFSRADQAMAKPANAFEWLLERASTNTPFTVTALAVARQPNTDIDEHARHVKDVVSAGIGGLIANGEPAWWMSPEVLGTTRSLFARNLNGIALTEIALSPNNVIEIDQARASAGVTAIAGIDALSAGKELSPRQAWGEIEGAMVAAGRYQKRPAIQIVNELYNYVWCILSKDLIAEFGDEHRLNEIWTGRSIGVKGKLIYAEGGRLSRIEATAIREIHRAAPIDLETIMDSDFTSGLHPVEYLRRLNDGEFA